METTAAPEEETGFELLVTCAEAALGVVSTSSTASAATAAGGLVSDDVALGFVAVYRWLGIAMCVVPFAFSLLNAGVYWQHRRSSHAIHLLAISAGNGMCSVLLLVTFLTALWHPPGSQTYQVVSWYLANYIAGSCRRAAICLNLLVTLERFLAISFPLKDFSRRVAGKPRLTVLAVFALTFAAHAYLLLEYHIVVDADGKWKTLRTSLAISNSGILLVTGNVVSVFFLYAPLLLSLLLNLALVVVFRRHRDSTRNMRISAGGTRETMQQASPQTATSVSDKTDNRIAVCVEPRDPDEKAESAKLGRGHDSQSVTTMVVVFSAVYTAMSLPRVVHFSVRTLLPGAYGPSGSERNLHSIMDVLTQICTHLTEVAQFCLSCIYSRQFRKGVSRLLIVRVLCGSHVSQQSLASSAATSQSSCSQAEKKSSGKSSALKF